MGIVQTAVSKFRTTILIMIFLIIMGIMGRSAMPVASNPNITFPWVTVSVFLEGASPEDMARLVAKPIENRLIMFNPSYPHRVSAIRRGRRRAIIVNAWPIKPHTYRD